jgi:hypothetical protein
MKYILFWLAKPIAGILPFLIIFAVAGIVGKISNFFDRK